MLLAMLALAAGAARAELQVTEVTEPPDPGIEDTDHYWEVTDPGRWQVLVDANTGAVFSFVDLTDSGVIAEEPPAPYATGDHVNYVGTATCGTDYCFHLQAPLLSVEGRSGELLNRTDRIFTCMDPVVGLADRLSFCWDATSFTIVYAEDAAAEDFLWDPSEVLVGGTPAGEAGDLLTTATLTLNAATAEGTVFRLAVATVVNLPGGRSLHASCFAANSRVVSNVRSDESYGTKYAYQIAQTIDWQDAGGDGPWDPDDPASFIRRTITGDPGNLALGLAADRTFVLDHVSGCDGNPNGGLFFDDGTWACGRALYQQVPWGMDLTGGTVKTHVVDLRINIARAASPPPGIETAETAPGQQWCYQNTPTTTADRHTSTVILTLYSEFQPGETYTVSVDDGDGNAAQDQFRILPGEVTQEGLQITVPLHGGWAQAPAGEQGSTPGAYTVTLTVTGEASGWSDSAEVELALRAVGDIDGDGSRTGVDKQFFNQRLNNVATPHPDRAYDLDGSGGAPTGTDKQVMNQALNNAPLP